MHTSFFAWNIGEEEKGLKHWRQEIKCLEWASSKFLFYFVANDFQSIEK